MLKTIYIDSLFDVYTYTLELKSEEVPFRFITGPNGYGKTTILNILNALYTGDMRMIATVPFKNIRLVFDDGYEVNVEQLRDYVVEEKSDEKLLSNIGIHIVFKKKDMDSPVNVLDWNSSEENEGNEERRASGMSLYFRSHPIYYIRDGRIRTPDGMPTIKRCVERMKDLLHENEQSKNAEFDARIQAFHDIIARSGFAHKQMQTDVRYGFRFVADNEEHTILSTDKLSSGEQHILIMTFELLFLAPDDSLVLIDEPEMSFHMLWQVDYLHNLRIVTSLRNVQCLICTHSPQIFNMDWGLTVDLYTQSEAN